MEMFFVKSQQQLITVLLIMTAYVYVTVWVIQHMHMLYNTNS